MSLKSIHSEPLSPEKEKPARIYMELKQFNNKKIKRKKRYTSWEWGHKPVIPARRRQR
jgi:hypothetical protein